MTDAAVDLAEERLLRNQRIDERAGREPERPAPKVLYGDALAADHEALHERIRDLLRENPKLSGAAAHRTLGEPLHYVTFMEHHFKPIKERRERAPGILAPAAAVKAPPVSLAPGRPKRAEAPDAGIQYRADAGHFEARALGGGEWEVSLKVRVSRRVAVSLAGNAWSLLYPEG